MCLASSDNNGNRNAAIIFGSVVAASVIYENLKDKDIFKCKKNQKV